MKKMNNKGFSLVELIIVMAIMAVLIGVMAPAYSKYVEQAKKSRDVSSIDSMMTAVESVLIDVDARKEGEITVDGKKIHQIVLKFEKDNTKIVIDPSTCKDAATELKLILGEEGTVVAGTWKIASGDDMVETGDSTLKATIVDGFVDFEIGSETNNFFAAVADYSDDLADRME